MTVSASLPAAAYSSGTNHLVRVRQVMHDLCKTCTLHLKSLQKPRTCMLRHKCKSADFDSAFSHCKSPTRSHSLTLFTPPTSISLYVAPGACLFTPEVVTQLVIAVLKAYKLYLPRAVFRCDFCTLDISILAPSTLQPSASGAHS